MASGGGWNWDDVTSAFWSEPSEDVYYLLARWKKSRRSRIRMLDLGCGMGRHSLLFAENGFEVTALDSSESGLRKLEASAAERGLEIEVVHADLTKLPFDDGSFDAVLAYHSIYHVDSEGIVAAISELHRVMRPGAEVYVTFNSKSNPTYADPRNQVVDANVRMKQEEDGTVLPHYYCDVGDIRRLLSQFGIIRLRQIEDMFEDRSSWHYFVLAARAV